MTIEAQLSEDLTLEDYSLEELEEFMVSEDYEALDELSKKTLGNYVNRAVGDFGNRRSDITKSQEQANAIRVRQHTPHDFSPTTGKAISDELEDRHHTLINRGEKSSDVALRRRIGIKRAVSKLTKESIQYDSTEDMKALTEGEELSEEFKTKAATIFEAAVVTRVKAEVAKLEESFEQRVEKDVEEKVEGLYEKVDGYLDYCVEQWMNDNEVALETGIKADITENFINGLKNLFVETYIDIPTEKLDLVGDLTEKVSSLEEQLTEAIDQAVATSRKLEEVEIANMVKESAEGLTDVDKEKFKELSKELVFENAESFASKLKVIRESYFKQPTKSGVQSIVSSDTSDILSEDTSTRNKSHDPRINQYAGDMNKLF